MAETDSPPPPQSVRVDEKKLKYLDFVQVVAIYVIVLFSSIYNYAKGNSGPLKSGIQTVQGAVQAVIGPVYHKFRDVPFQLLVFIDRKIDELMTEMHKHTPSLIKEASTKARAIALDVKQAGVVETATNAAKTVYVKYEPVAKEYYDKYEPVAKEYYDKYEPVAEKYVVVAWCSLNRLPLFPHLAHVLVPTAAYFAQIYNQTVVYFASRGYRLSDYVPLVPVDRIAKIFKTAENGHAVSNGDAADMKTQ